MEELGKALSSFLGNSELLGELAEALALASGTGYVSFDEIERIAEGKAEDVILLGFGWRLLLPVRSSRCGEWDDRLLLAEPGERYELPNIVKWLVNNAMHTGQWNPDQALTELFQTMGEVEWKRMPMIVERLMEKSRHHKIDAAQIKEACHELGLGDRADSLIAELKGGGVMSPKLDPLAELAKTQGGPLYELNPCLFKE